MQTRTITLGERTYEIQELRSKQNVAWRRQLEETLAPLLDMFQNADRLEIDNPQQVSQMLREMRGLLFRSPETLTELLFAYSETLRQDREYIEENAYDSELLNAFTQIVQLAYPFGGLLRMVERLSNAGSETTPAPQTSTN